MKRLLLLVLLLTSITLKAQIIPHANLELGYEDRRTAIEFGGVSTTSWWLIQKQYADIKLFADYKDLTVFTNVKTYFATDKIYSYTPFQVEYKIGIQYEYNRFLFKAEHLCSHSVQSKAFYEVYDRFSVNIILF